jgi:micrococcal nuclease
MAILVGCSTPVALPATSPNARPVVAIQPTPTPWATVKPPLAPSGATETAKVVRIVDGDTIVVSLGGKNVKVRYIGMDTPEDVDPNSPVEPMSREAAAANQNLVAGKTVVLEKDVSETDQYGRLLRYVWLHDGAAWTLVNLELVRLGLAFAISYPPDVRYDDLLASAEGTAQSSFVGLWGPAVTAAPAVTPKPTPKATPKPTPKPTPRPTKVPAKCHPSYLPCLPIVGDLDCPDVRAMGLAPVHVIGPDSYRLDGDHDGIGCE